MEWIAVSKPFKNKVVMAIFVVWVGLATSVMWQFYQVSSSSSTLDELNNRLMHFRDSLNFSQPYRSKQASELELEISLLFSLRRQIEIERTTLFFVADVQQLLYQVDRFIEQMRGFLEIELQPTTLAELLRQNRQSNQSDEQLLNDYFQLGALSFEAMFADSRNHPEIYRHLDQLLKYSLSLPNDEQAQLQGALALLSRVLTKNAEGKNIVSKLLNHAVYEEASLLEATYHHQLWLILIFFVFISLVSMIALLILPSYCRPKAFRVEHSSQVAYLEDKKNSHVNIDHIQQMLNGSKDSVLQLLNVFLEDHKNDDEKIRALLVSAPEVAQRVSHSLKSVATTLGAQQLKNTAANIESKLHSGLIPNEMELENLTTYLAQTTQEVEQHLARLQAHS